MEGAAAPDIEWSQRTPLAPAPAADGVHVVSMPKACTLANYAAAKGLPVSFLKDCGLADGKWQGRPAVTIPYWSADDDEPRATRYRTAITKSAAGDDARFRWESGSKPLLYGLWRVRELQALDSVVLVEGESDCHTLWWNDVSALGIPGASTWKDAWSAALESFRKIYLVVEPDGGGTALRERLMSSPLSARLRFVHLEAAKDPSDLFLQHPTEFRSRWATAVAEADRRAIETMSGAVGEAVPSTRFPDSFRLLDDVQVMELEDPQWIIEGAIPKLARVTIYAPPNTAKTTLTAGLCVSIATGQPWFGRQVKVRGGCIYVPSEDVNGFKVRLAAAKAAARLDPSEPAGIFTFPDGINLVDASSVRLFIDFVNAQHGAFAAVVIDTLSGSMPGANENNIEAMGLAMSHAKLIMNELGVTVVLLHHTNAAGSRERGHTVIRGESDTMIALEPVDDVVKVECNKQRNGPLFPAFEVRVVPKGASVVLRLAKDVAVPADALSEPQRRALLALRDHFTGDGATKGEWKAVATATGMSESTFWRVTKTLEERRYVSPMGQKFRMTSGGSQLLTALGV